MMVFIATSGPAIDWPDPTARNSKRFPVKAKGLVRLRSPASLGSVGRVSTPTISVSLPLELLAPPLATCSKMSVSCSPRKTEMIAGGASLAPSRWSLEAVATTARSSPLQRWTARITAAQKTRNCALACGVSPGSSRLPWVALPIEKLTCLPEPLTPANGFSCSRQAMPYLLGHPLQRDHQQLLMVGGEVGVLEHRRDLELARRHLVVPRLGRDAELEQFALGFEHEGQHPLGDRAEVMILELLALWVAARRTASVRSRAGRAARKRSAGRSGNTPARRPA